MPPCQAHRIARNTVTCSQQRPCAIKKQCVHEVCATKGCRSAMVLTVSAKLRITDQCANNSV